MSGFEFWNERFGRNKTAHMKPLILGHMSGFANIANHSYSGRLAMAMESVKFTNLIWAVSSMSGLFNDQFQYGRFKTAHIGQKKISNRSYDPIWAVLYDRSFSNEWLWYQNRSFITAHITIWAYWDRNHSYKTTHIGRPLIFDMSGFEPLIWEFLVCGVA